MTLGELVDAIERGMGTSITDPTLLARELKVAIGVNLEPVEDVALNEDGSITVMGPP